jgi:hypothetical protein
MASATNVLTMLWKDNKGKIGRMVLLVAAAAIDPSGGGIATVRAAIAAVVKAYNYQASLSFAATVSDTGALGVYADNEDKVQMRFKDEDGETHSYLIPAPLASIFDADGETVNPANGAVDTFISAVTTNVKTKSGRDIVTFLGGRRMRRDRKAA